MYVLDDTKCTVFCDCGHEAFHVEQDEGGNTWLSIYCYGNKDWRRSIVVKWKFIWHIIRYGTPYGDMVILLSAGRKVLIDTLLSHDREEKKSE